MTHSVCFRTRAFACATTAAALVYPALGAIAGSIQQPGLTTGAPEGFGMTEGLYSMSVANIGAASLSGSGSMNSAVLIPAMVTWSTPWDLAGGHLSFKAAPGVFVDMSSPGMRKTSHYSPYFGAWMSWYLGGGFNVSFGEGVQVGLGSPVDRALGRDFNAFQQNLAITYLRNNWHVTANSFYTTGRTNSSISQPQTFNLDFTVSKREGRVEYGLIGYGEWDLNRPSVGYGGKQSEVSVGALVGYLIGNQMSLQLKVSHAVHQQNIGGNDTRVWSALMIPLYTPSAPEPSNALYPARERR